MTRSAMPSFRNGIAPGSDMNLVPGGKKYKVIDNRFSDHYDAGIQVGWVFKECVDGAYQMFDSLGCISFVRAEQKFIDEHIEKLRETI